MKDIEVRLKELEFEVNNYSDSAVNIFEDTEQCYLLEYKGIYIRFNTIELAKYKIYKCYDILFYLEEKLVADLKKDIKVGFKIKFMPPNYKIVKLEKLD